MDIEFFWKMYSIGTVDRNQFPTFEKFLDSQIKAYEEAERKRKRTPSEIEREEKEWEKETEEREEKMYCQDYMKYKVGSFLILFGFFVLVPIIFFLNAYKFSLEAEEIKKIALPLLGVLFPFSCVIGFTLVIDNPLSQFD